MATSTRSSWTGTLSLDLLAIPVTLATTVRESREEAIKTICACHHQPIDSSERCASTQQGGMDKLKGVKMPDGSYKPVPESEWAAIEDGTKDDVMEILDVQPISEFPMAFSTETKWVRAKKDDRAAAGALGALVAGLGKSRMGCVVKLCKSAKQNLAVLWSYQGYALLTYIPFLDQFVRPGDAERAHMKVEVPEATVDRVIELFEAHRCREGFQWAAFENTGLTLRQALVDRTLADPAEASVPQPVPMIPDLMAKLEASLKAKPRSKAAA